MADYRTTKFVTRSSTILHPNPRWGSTDRGLISDRGSIARTMISERLGTSLPIGAARLTRSEEHTSELQSLMRISYAVFCLKKQKKNIQTNRKQEKATLITL